MIVLTGNNAYALEHDHRNGWNADAFKERYSEVLERYDYIVGDWGYNQLRLRGFYRDGHPKATKDTTITCLVDYLNEYCNFGCAYFVLQKTDLKAAVSGMRAQAGDDTAAGSAAAQASETAAAAAGSQPNTGGMITRWPPKERQGHPVRMPGAAAVARAAEDAERRGLHTQPNGGGSHASDKRSSHNNRAAGQTDNRSGGKHHSSGRPSRSSHHDRQTHSHAGKAAADRTQEAPRRAESADQKQETGRNGIRWPGKNRKKNRFGPKPNRSNTAAKSGGHGGQSGQSGQSGDRR